MNNTYLLPLSPIYMMGNKTGTGQTEEALFGCSGAAATGKPGVDWQWGAASTGTHRSSTGLLLVWFVWYLGTC